VSCTCGGINREGIPCQCFWAITDNDVIREEEVADIGMIDVRFLKAFDARYGDDSELGKWLYKAQGIVLNTKIKGPKLVKTMHRR